jgi:two-component system, OmpR family, sensor histidine kinase BaeS
VRLALVLALSSLVVGVVELTLLSARTNQLINALPPEIRVPLRSVLVTQGGRPRPLLSLVREQFLLSLGIGAAFSVAVAVLAALRFSAGLENLAATARRIAAGDFSARSHAVSSTQEVTALIHDVNAMAGQLETFEANRRYSNAAIAHELRTPLTALRTRVAGLADGVFPLTPTEVLKLHRQLDVLARLAEDLQTLSLVDVGGLRLEPCAVDWYELVAQAVADAEHQAFKQNLNLHLEPASAKPEVVRVRGDPARLRQIVHNLLENALRHMPSGGDVQVRVDWEAGSGVLRVSDSGPGVPDAELSRIFERYYRAETSRSRGSGSSGLGLTIVQALVAAHGGTVTARRGELGGLEVEVRIPSALAH